MTDFYILPGAPADSLVRLCQNLVAREVTIKPAMCGHNARLAAQIGDWTWETVSQLCGVNAFRAADRHGIPTYLSFFYYELIGDQTFHLHTPTFGDRLQVVSRCYGFGPESILTLHRLAPADRALPVDLSAHEMRHERHPGALYVQTFNRWIQRGNSGNRALHSAAPEGFQHQQLERLGPELSPRLSYDAARRSGSFVVPEQRGLRLRDEAEFPYEIDMARDLNGVGLLYFSSYFEIADSALARMWRQLGRSDSAFLERVVSSQRLLFLGNADACTALVVHLRRYGVPGEDGHDVYDIDIKERDSGRVLAVIELCCEEKK